jgi:hypothetical protein
LFEEFPIEKLPLGIRINSIPVMGSFQDEKASVCLLVHPKIMKIEIIKQNPLNILLVDLLPILQ